MDGAYNTQFNANLAQVETHAPQLDAGEFSNFLPGFEQLGDITSGQNLPYSFPSLGHIDNGDGMNVAHQHVMQQHGDYSDNTFIDTYKFTLQQATFIWETQVTPSQPLQQGATNQNPAVLTPAGGFASHQSPTYNPAANGIFLEQQRAPRFMPTASDYAASFVSRLQTEQALPSVLSNPNMDGNYNLPTGQAFTSLPPTPSAGGPYGLQNQQVHNLSATQAFLSRPPRIGGFNTSFEASGYNTHFGPYGYTMANDESPETSLNTTSSIGVSPSLHVGADAEPNQYMFPQTAVSARSNPSPALIQSSAAQADSTKFSFSRCTICKEIFRGERGLGSHTRQKHP